MPDSNSSQAALIKRAATGPSPGVSGCVGSNGGASDLAAILAGCLLWGLAWWPMKALAAIGLNGPLLAITAYGAAAIALLPAVLRQQAAWLAAWRPLLAITIAGGIWNVSYMTAMVDGHASRVVLLYYLSSGWAIIGGRVFFRESIEPCRWIAVILVFSGVCLVLSGPELAFDDLSTADLMAIAAGIAHASTNLMFRSLEQVPLGAKNLAMFIGAVLAATLAIQTAAPDAPIPTASVLLAGAVFGVVWLLLAESLTQHGVSRLPATQSSMLLISELPVTVISASVIANERPGPVELAGGGLIILATVIAVLRPPSVVRPATHMPRRGLHERNTAFLQHHVHQ